MPTTIPSDLTGPMRDAYVVHLRLDEISRKLRTGDVLPHGRERSASPPPVYGADGKRVNTREYRYRKRLLAERDKLVEDSLRRIPGFRPPADWRRPSKYTDKIYIPVRDFPEVNFMGLIIGPRGRTLKQMEADTGAKVSIRGRGAVQEGGRAGGPRPQDQEDMHCLISADTPDKLAAAVDRINQIIELSTSTADADNELKRNQLRELASLNGTLRDDENKECLNCGQIGHRKFDCPERTRPGSVGQHIVCHACGGAGHMARDCFERAGRHGPPPAAPADSPSVSSDTLASEYARFMREVGGEVPAASSGGAAPTGRMSLEEALATAPWRRRSGPPSGGPAPLRA